MTATDELRRLLDEAGVEWESGLPTETIVREPNDVLYVERPDGRMHIYFRSYLTPEQAIAATVGREPDDAALLKLHDRMNVALLEFERAMGIEKADGAIVVPFVVEVHHLLEEAATVGRGTCHMETDDSCQNWNSCSECGADYYTDQPINYCPNCGRRVVDE